MQHNLLTIQKNIILSILLILLGVFKAVWGLIILLNEGSLISIVLIVFGVILLSIGLQIKKEKIKDNVFILLAFIGLNLAIRSLNFFLSFDILALFEVVLMIWAFVYLIEYRKRQNK